MAQDETCKIRIISLIIQSAQANAGTVVRLGGDGGRSRRLIFGEDRAMDYRDKLIQILTDHPDLLGAALRLITAELHGLGLQEAAGQIFQEEQSA